ncbi:MAG: hypothetical protein CFH44_00502 [Proteobacteria bacterium]|nr:MAG: hypothetical protein CFH44_00502 [Pseudomonadota bacterium]
MIITCPECKTRYMIKSEKLGLDPKPVRCAKCKHQWTVNPSPLMSENYAEKPPLPPIARLSSPSLADQQKVLNDKIKKRNVFVFSFLGFLVLGSLLTIIIFKDRIITKYPDMASVYELVGFSLPEQEQNFAGLAIQNVERSQEKTSDMTILSFSGNVKNTSDIEVPVPNVKVQLFDEEGILLDEWTAQPEHKTLKPDQTTSWVCRFYDPPLAQISRFKTFFEK